MADELAACWVVMMGMLWAAYLAAEKELSLVDYLVDK